MERHYTPCVLEKFPGLEITPRPPRWELLGCGGHGAAAILMTTPDSTGTRPAARARIVATANMGDETHLAMWNTPVPATKKVLAKAGMTLADIDLFEVNEAFAHRCGEVHPRSRHRPAEDRTVNRGLIALGHPIGATGTLVVGAGTQQAGAPGHAGRPHHHVRRWRGGVRASRVRGHEKPFRLRTPRGDYSAHIVRVHHAFRHAIGHRRPSRTRRPLRGGRRHDRLGRGPRRPGGNFRAGLWAVT